VKLYLIHCGFYDADLCGGLYESHVNFFVAANSFDDAKSKAKLIPAFASKRMHIDGIQELTAVNGHVVQLKEDLSLQGETIIQNYKHRDLASKPSVAAPHIKKYGTPRTPT
jgi:hypothetical protein